MKKIKKQSRMKYRLPFGLKKDINNMGYKYSDVTTAITYGAVLFACILLGKIYDLGSLCIAAITLFAFLAIPDTIRRIYQRKNYMQKFTDASSYMEQFLYSFRKVPKIYDAFKDVRDLFQDGQMRTCITAAIAHMETAGYSKNDLNQETLGIIEAEYSNERLNAMHTFVQQVEKEGGGYQMSIDILQKDKTNWVNSVSSHYQEITSWRRNIIISILIAGGLSAVPNYMIGSMMPDGTTLGSFPIYQVAVLAALVILIQIFAKADRMTTIDWFQPKYNQKVNFEDRYERIVNWNPKKEFLGSLVFAAIPVFLGVVCLIRHMTVGTFVMLALAIFLLFQHQIGYKISYKSVIQKIQMEFPKWLLDIALRLQSDNVQNSIAGSFESAHPILKPELRKMLDKLKVDPTSAAPFTEFMDAFDIREIRSAMKLLYSLSSVDAGNPDEQISDIITRNNNMLIKSEELKQKDEIGGLFGMMMMPTFPGIIIFCAGLIVFTIAFFTQSFV